MHDECVGRDVGGGVGRLGGGFRLGDLMVGSSAIGTTLVMEHIVEVMSVDLLPDFQGQLHNFEHIPHLLSDTVQKDIHEHGVVGIWVTCLQWYVSKLCADSRLHGKRVCQVC